MLCLQLGVEDQSGGFRLAVVRDEHDLAVGKALPGEDVVSVVGAVVILRLLAVLVELEDAVPADHEQPAVREEVDVQGLLSRR